MITVGSIIGNYTVVSKLAEGAMAAVFLAEHPRIGKRVAIKVIHPELSTSQEMVSRFFTEAKTVSQIHNEHVVEIQDYGQTPEGDNFIVMEFLDGITLASLVRDGVRLDAQRATYITQQVAQGLAAAHSRGVVHRDLKPDNIFLLRKGQDQDFVKILDFGLAKLTGGPAMENQHRTRTGSVLGTPHFMAPEQCEGKVQVDARADVYSLGCILFLMLTGELPFPGDGFGEVLVKHLRERPPSPRALVPSIPVGLDKIILHCLAKKRDYRFASVEELSEALRDPERFSQLIGDDPLRIMGPMPGDPVPQGPPPAAPIGEMPATLIGSMPVGGFQPPASAGFTGAAAAPDQRTIVGGMSPFAQQQGQPQQPAAANMETLIGGMQQGQGFQPLAAQPPPQQAYPSQQQPLAVPPSQQSYQQAAQPQGAFGRTVMLEPGGPAPTVQNLQQVPAAQPPAQTGRTLMVDPGTLQAQARGGRTLMVDPSGAPVGSPHDPFPRPALPAPPAAPTSSKLPLIILAVLAVAIVVVGTAVALRPKVQIITVVSVPEHAKVVRDGQPAGQTPYELKIKKGDPDTKLVLQLAGYLDSVRMIQSATAVTGALRVDLLPRPPKEKDTDDDDQQAAQQKPEQQKPEQQPDAGKPAKPDKPARPEKPAKPDKSARPEKPAKPDKSATKPGTGKTRAGRHRPSEPEVFTPF